mgnify:CR=1 FL=1
MALAKLLKLLLMTILTGYGIWQITLMVGIVFPDEQSILNHTPSTLMINNSSQISSLDINNLLMLNLFGKADIIDSEKVIINVPETKLNIKLTGLRLGKGSIPSSAIIQGEDNRQLAYQQGDSLIDNKSVSIHEIHEQHLILQRKNSYETLTLFDVLEQNKYKQSTAILTMPVLNDGQEYKKSRSPANMWVLPK